MSKINIHADLSDAEFDVLAKARTVAGKFAATGARSTANKDSLDILWRNARARTTHDPVSYRAREVGARVLAEVPPRPRTCTQPPQMATQPEVAITRKAS